MKGWRRLMKSTEPSALRLRLRRDFTSGRQVDGRYEVEVNGAWVSVPAGRLAKRIPQGDCRKND
jgi:hypothetical protein